MRKCILKPDEVKRRVKMLVGKPVKISVNRGRRKFACYSGEVASVFPSVFILKIEGSPTISTLSVSYSDLICGEVRLKVKKTAEI